jgi:hypothetical protein
MSLGRRLPQLVATTFVAVVAIAAMASPTAQTARTQPDPRSVVSVRDSDGAPCPDIAVRRLEVRGGCKVKVVARATQFTAFTLLGENALAQCIMTFTMAFDSSGALAVDAMEIIAADSVLGGACGDIMQCRRNFTAFESWAYQVPWRGRLLKPSGGGAIAEIDACFDSCLGRLEGKLRLTLANSRRGLRLRAARSPVGVSGLELDGRWKQSPRRQPGIRISRR